jgi:hypothetical protein
MLHGICILNDAHHKLRLKGPLPYWGENPTKIIK